MNFSGIQICDKKIWKAILNITQQALLNIIIITEQQ